MMLVNLAGTSFVDYDLLKDYRMRIDANQKVYCKVEMRDVSPKRHDTQYQRYKWCRKIRDNVTIDITRNNIEPKCLIDGIYHLQNKKQWGVVCSFDYE